MFGLGPTELFLGLVVILLLFGAKRIPEIAGSFGKSIKEFKKGMNEVQREINAPAEQGSLPPADRRTTVQHDDSPVKEPKRLI
ncbi:MAG TPA: twin-arginine translocase TatA/TatE family subunit [Gemmatimonadaceae bacterium]|jgi:sec-independent protein translocase protein TatA|nr:twin-arginine translocase TatA/TatE family subunit [Gemmatimonadaceae bacterium]